MLENIKFIVLYLFVILFFSCNKERRINRNLQGRWEVDKVKLQDVDGFSFFDNNPKGELLISDKTVQGEITSSFQTFLGSVSDTLALYGSYYLNLDNTELNWLQSPDTIKNQIFVITNKNLEIECYNAISQQRMRYVFKKIR